MNGEHDERPWTLFANLQFRTIPYGFAARAIDHIAIPALFGFGDSDNQDGVSSQLMISREQRSAAF